MQASSNPRLYTIQDDGSYFHTGRMTNGDQGLIGVQLPELVLVVFDAQGNYQSIATSTIPRQFLPVKNDAYQPEDWVLLALIQKWQDELGITPGTICVKQFYLPDRWIGIKDLPEHYQQVVNGLTEGYEEEELRTVHEEIRTWIEDGDFILCWDEEYYFNREGELVAT